MRQHIISHLSSFEDDIYEFSKHLYENPEESFNEYKAYSYIVDMLKEHNFDVQEHFCQIPTSFYASYGSGYPKICYLCEYDAVKDKGHVVGHNLVSAMSLTAAIGLSSVMDKFEGTVIVIGCPGEYTSGAKVTLAKQGVFDDIDVVLMAHPDVSTHQNGTSMAILPLKITYKSTSGFTYRSTASYSALDACLFTFNAIGLLEKGFPEDCSIDGIIAKGGSTPSMNPSEAEGKFYIRAAKMCDAVKIECKIRELAKTVGSIMDVSSEVNLYELPYEELIPNDTLSRIFTHNLKESGIINVGDSQNTMSGLSLGTVSHIVPCIHPYIGIIDNPEIQYSSKEFADATISKYATENVLKAGYALAFTGLDMIEREDLLREVKMEFDIRNKASKKSNIITCQLI